MSDPRPFFTSENIDCTSPVSLPESSSVRKDLPGVGWVEVATWAGVEGTGAVYAPTRDFICGYVKQHEGSPWLCDWKGKPFLHLREVSSWPVRSWRGERMYAYRASVAGRSWHGRGFGEGQNLTLRPNKR